MEKSFLHCSFSKNHSPSCTSVGTEGSLGALLVAMAAYGIFSPKCSMIPHRFSLCPSLQAWNQIQNRGAEHTWSFLEFMSLLVEPRNQRAQHWFSICGGKLTCFRIFNIVSCKWFLGLYTNALFNTFIAPICNRSFCKGYWKIANFLVSSF